MSCTITINLNYKNLPSESINRTHAHRLVEGKRGGRRRKWRYCLCDRYVWSICDLCRGRIIQSASQPVSNVPLLIAIIRLGKIVEIYSLDRKLVLLLQIFIHSKNLADAAAAFTTTIQWPFTLMFSLSPCHLFLVSFFLAQFDYQLPGGVRDSMKQTNESLDVGRGIEWEQQKDSSQIEMR